MIILYISNSKQKIGSGSFHIEDGVIYCSKDFAAMFSVKCAGCEFPIEPLDKFFEALGQKYHTECFICSVIILYIEILYHH